MDSIVNQTYDNLEIVLVNDGSTDSSGDICKSYVDIDKRIKYIEKTNSGVMDARVVGIKNFFINLSHKQLFIELTFLIPPIHFFKISSLI